jgi:hypothetical protein
VLDLQTIDNQYLKKNGVALAMITKQ